MRARHAMLFAAFFARSFLPGDARADDKATCLQAHEHGQEVRLTHRWIEARRLFLECARSSCPALIVQDCTRWEDELSQRIPSVVVAAKGADGADLGDVALSIDGAHVASRLPVVPILLDPGEHVLRFEHASSSPVERRIILQDGQQERRVEVAFDFSQMPATRSTGRAGAPVGAFVVSGLAAAATVTSIIFLAIGKTSEHDLAASPCGQAGMCANAQVQPIRADYIVSATGAGVAAVAATIAVWMFIAYKKPNAQALVRAGRIEF